MDVLIILEMLPIIVFVIMVPTHQFNIILVISLVTLNVEIVMKKLFKLGNV